MKTYLLLSNPDNAYTIGLQTVGSDVVLNMSEFGTFQTEVQARDALSAMIRDREAHTHRCVYCEHVLLPLMPDGGASNHKTGCPRHAEPESADWVHEKFASAVSTSRGIPYMRLMRT